MLGVILRVVFCEEMLSQTVKDLRRNCLLELVLPLKCKLNKPMCASNVEDQRFPAWCGCAARWAEGGRLRGLNMISGEGRGGLEKLEA